VIFVVQGSDGDVREVRSFNAQTGAPIDAVPETHPDFCGAYFVATLDNRSLPEIDVFTSNGQIVRLLPYGPTYFGDVRVATGDITGDGIDEIITAPGRNYKPLIRIFSQDGVLLEEFLAYSATFKGGVDVEIGDVTGDHQNDIVTAMSYGGNQVKVFRNPTGEVLGTPTPFNPAYNFGTATTVATAFSSFNPFGSTFKGGAVVELADMGKPVTVNSVKKLDSTQFDGRSEIVVANQAGMRSTVKTYSYFGTSTTATVVRTFLPFDTAFRGGLSLDVGRVGDDLVPDIIVGAGRGGASRVQVLNGETGTVMTSFNAFSAGETPNYNAKVDVKMQDADRNGIVDFLLAARDFDGKSREVRRFQPLTGELVDSFFENYPGT